LNVSAVLIATFRNPDPSPVPVSDLCRNLETLFCPRLKVGAHKFGKLAPLQRLTGLQRRCVRLVDGSKSRMIIGRQRCVRWCAVI